MHPFVDGELSERIRDLFEDQGEETGVEGGETFGGGHFGETRDETGGVLCGIKMTSRHIE